MYAEVGTCCFKSHFNVQKKKYTQRWKYSVSKCCLVQITSLLRKSWARRRAACPWCRLTEGYIGECPSADGCYGSGMKPQAKGSHRCDGCRRSLTAHTILPRLISSDGRLRTHTELKQDKSRSTEQKAPCRKFQGFKNLTHL